MASPRGLFLALGLMQQDRAPLVGSAVLAVALLVQHFYWPSGFNVVLGSFFVLAGIIGLARGKITVGGKAGPSRTHIGLPAYLWSLAFVAIGILILWQRLADSVSAFLSSH